VEASEGKVSDQGLLCRRPPFGPDFHQHPLAMPPLLSRSSPLPLLVCLPAGADWACGSGTSTSSSSSSVASAAANGSHGGGWGQVREGGIEPARSGAGAASRASSILLDFPDPPVILDALVALLVLCCGELYCKPILHDGLHSSADTSKFLLPLGDFSVCHLFNRGTQYLASDLCKTAYFS
jgi:hypothetical protein